ncbi:hypothetical protein ABVF47_003235 [Snodgrassella alvi]|uniref:hypothetical protein n=1 Tax=Snodgrassella alvi TaxID=1196083 RepID=UPI00352C8680
MATNIVEQMLIELGIDTSKYLAEAEKTTKKNQELEKSLANTEKASKQVGKSNEDLAKKYHNSITPIAKMGQEIAKVTKELTGFFAIIIGSTGLFKLANDAARANMEVSNLSGQLGMNTRGITDWQNAAGAFGGSAEGMTASLSNIKQSMNGLVMFGDASMLPYFNALGVNVVDNAGKIRQLDDVMLDLADAFQKMPRDQAYTIGKKMGFDDGTINALVSGRKELQEILNVQKQMYHSDQKAIAQSKELTKQQAILSAHWQSMKQLIGDALTPILIALIRVVNGFFELLQKHQKVIKGVFQVAAIIIGMLLIPTLLSATRVLLGFIAPFTPLLRVIGALGAAISPVIALVTALAAAFVLLYDDYKTWANGGKSLFDWTSFAAGIKDSKMSVDTLREAFGNLVSAVKNNTIPTLKGYAEILGKLVRGDFSGAAKQAKQMIDTYSDIATGIVADAMGEKKQDVAGFIGESVYKLTHGGKDYHEYNGTAKPVEQNAVTAGNSRQVFKNKNFTIEKAESIARVAKNIGVDPNDLAAVISFETGGTFNPNIRNPKSSATGLIQFMAGSGGKKGLYYGMTRDQFGGLSFDEQMKYVERYFRERGFDGKKKRDVADTYTAVTGYGYRKGSKAYELNRVWDSNKDDYIAKGEMVKNDKFRAHQRQYYSSIANNAQKAQDMSKAEFQFRNEGRGIKNDNRKHVSVNIQKIEVKTSSSSVSGNTVAAVKEANNYMFNQLGTSMT